MAITMLSYLLIDGVTAWSVQPINVSYWLPQNSAATRTRVFMADSMHQDIDESPSDFETDVDPHIGWSSFTMIDSATTVYVNDDMVTSIEPRTGNVTRIHLEGHWVIEVKGSYASVLLTLTT